MRVALASNTTSASAVLRSLLALSSLHRHGIQSQSFELKISSLKALSVASFVESKLGAMEVIQHIAAGMLLCSFEVSTHLDTPYSLLTHKIIRSTSRHALQANGHGI
jgi:hypothetical protein